MKYFVRIFRNKKTESGNIGRYPAPCFLLSIHFIQANLIKMAGVPNNRYEVNGEAAAARRAAIYDNLPDELADIIAERDAGNRSPEMNLLPDANPNMNPPPAPRKPKVRPATAKASARKLDFNPPPPPPPPGSNGIAA